MLTVMAPLQLEDSYQRDRAPKFPVTMLLPPLGLSQEKMGAGSSFYLITHTELNGAALSEVLGYLAFYKI
jgi:hypothetical protein